MRNKLLIPALTKCLNGEMLLLKLLAGQNLLAVLSVAALPERYLSAIQRCSLNSCQKVQAITSPLLYLAFIFL